MCIYMHYTRNVSNISGNYSVSDQSDHFFTIQPDNRIIISGYPVYSASFR